MPFVSLEVSGSAPSISRHDPNDSSPSLRTYIGSFSNLDRAPLCSDLVYAHGECADCGNDEDHIPQIQKALIRSRILYHVIRRLHHLIPEHV